MESDVGTSSVHEIGTEADAQDLVLVNTPLSGITERPDPAKVKRLVGGRKRSTKGMRNTHKSRISRGFSNPPLAVGTTITGSVEAKVGAAYLIAVAVGGENLKGVLYHVLPVHKVEKPRESAPPGEFQAADLKSKSSLRRRRRKFLRTDPNAPKRNRTAYSFFFAEKRPLMKETYPEMRAAKEISKSIAEAWNRLSQKEKEPYQELGIKDKERYRKEMADYVYQRLHKTKVLEEGTKADGGMPLEQNVSTPLPLDSMEEPEAHGAVSIEEDGSKNLVVDASEGKLEIEPIVEILLEQA